MRAESSGIHLDREDAAIIKAMIARGDRQHDIAAWFGVNGGRIGEISTGKTFSDVAPASAADIPPPGPYPNGRDATVVMEALVDAQRALTSAAAIVACYSR